MHITKELLKWCAVVESCKISYSEQQPVRAAVTKKRTERWNTGMNVRRI
jgi:hypothetical protein